MTKLEAVNTVLMGAGVLPVGALDTSGASNASIAEKTIDEVTRKVQEEGWHYETQYDVELTPNGSNQIPIPTGALEVDTCGADEWRDISMGASGLLYDKDNQTATFTGTLMVRVVTPAAFADIPPIVQDYIAARAARVYNRRFGFAARDNGLAEDESRCRTRAKQFNTRSLDVNMLETTEARRMRGNRRDWYARSMNA